MLKISLKYSCKHNKMSYWKIIVFLHNLILTRARSLIRKLKRNRLIKYSDKIVWVQIINNKRKEHSWLRHLIVIKHKNQNSIKLERRTLLSKQIKQIKIIKSNKARVQSWAWYLKQLLINTCIPEQKVQAIAVQNYKHLLIKVKRNHTRAN